MKKSIFVSFTLLAFFSFGCVFTTQELKEKEVSEYRLHYKMGLSYLEADRYKEALLEFLEAEKINPTSAELYNAMGIAYFGLGEKDAAINAYKKAIELDSSFSKAHTNLASLYIDQGKFKEAIEECNKALENKLYLTPEAAFTNRGYAYYRLGKTDEAIKDYFRAIRYNPHYTKAYENLIGLYLELDNTQAAKEILMDAKAMGLGSPALIYYKAVFSNMDGKKTEACDLFVRLIRDYPLSPWTKKARVYIDVLNCYGE